jgi:hypothetical protein
MVNYGSTRRSAPAKVSLLRQLVDGDRSLSDKDRRRLSELRRLDRSTARAPAQHHL